MILLTLLLSTANASPAPPLPVSPDVAAHAQSPCWSPDGTSLSWELNDVTKKSVALYTSTLVQGATPRRVVPPGGAASTQTAGFSTASAAPTAHELTYAPAALRRFAYSASGPTGDFDLYLDTGSPVAAAPGSDGNPAWSPDGTRIVYTSARSGQGDLYLVDISDLTAPPKQLTNDATSAEVYAAWSPDGRRVVYVGRTRQGDNLYLIDDVAHPAPKALTAWAHVQTRPVFSPDGARIAFYSNHDDPARFDLYVMPVGGTPTLVTRGVVLGDDGPAWTPDGRHLVFVKDDADAFDPVWAAPVSDPSKARALGLGTVGNTDVDVVKRPDGLVYVAVAAQGRAGDTVRDFRRIYVAQLPALP
jgi:Tol biopolymer transport system component